MSNLHRLHVRVDPDELREVREATGVANDSAIVRAAVTNLNHLVDLGHEEAVRQIILGALFTPGRQRRTTQAQAVQGDF